jgi:hypothetical protein
MKHAYVVSDSFVNVTDLSTGESSTIQSTDPRFSEYVNLIKEGKYSEFLQATNVKAALRNYTLESSTYSDIKFHLTDSTLFYSYKKQKKQPMPPVLQNRVIKIIEAGLDPHPMVLFMEKLLANPNPTAIEELFLFLDACQLPITDDGDFIAYKIVQNDYFDIYSQTMKNEIGDILEVPRFTVDADRNRTCSSGLHFCSKDYLNHYGSSSRASDRAMLVKINPADVVAIPSDYNNAKGRTCRYEVVGEVAGVWRDTLPKTDYTESPVVSEDNDYESYCDDDEYEAANKLFDSHFTFAASGKIIYRSTEAPVNEFDFYKYMSELALLSKRDVNRWLYETYNVISTECFDE